MILDQIKQPNDIKKIPEEQYEALAGEIREFLVDKVSHTGGHLASNLGVVELTMALHLEFDLPEDKIVWDVGHQSYTHKLLTGRRDGFDSLRSFKGMSGFPKRNESSCDAFNTGHSSTSISAGLGLAKGRDLQGQEHFVISVIGDGSLTGGMAFEGLNNASQMKSNFIIVLNDNDMSISSNVGGLSQYLGSIRTADAYTGLKESVLDRLSRVPNGEQLVKTIRKTKSSIKQLLIPGMLFENLGITYLGPVDGHDVGRLRTVIEEAKKVKGPVLVHVRTVKGKGYGPAEENPEKFHGIGPFDIETGKAESSGCISYTEVFSRALSVIGKQNKKVVAITAAMPEGTGLDRFAREFPQRYYDVGIAEQHGVTFAAGLAASGLIPVVAIYSSFLQRAYDQIIHDVCMQGLHVIFAVDRAGLVGSDGETHQGLLDLSYLTNIPGMTVLAPKNRWELIDMLQFAVDYDGPVAIRYPRGKAYEGLSEFRTPIAYGKAECIYEDSEVAFLAVGTMVKWADKTRTKLRKLGIGTTLVNARFVKPLDEELIRHIAGEHKLIVTMEENVGAGGFGEHVENLILEENLHTEVLRISLPDEYIEHGSFESLKSDLNLDVDNIVTRILGKYYGE